LQFLTVKDIWKLVRVNRSFCNFRWEDFFKSLLNFDILKYLTRVPTKGFLSILPAGVEQVLQDDFTGEYRKYRTIEIKGKISGDLQNSKTKIMELFQDSKNVTGYIQRTSLDIKSVYDVTIVLQSKEIKLLNYKIDALVSKSQDFLKEVTAINIIEDQFKIEDLQIFVPSSKDGPRKNRSSFAIQQKKMC